MRRVVTAIVSRISLRLSMPGGVSVGMILCNVLVILRYSPISRPGYTYAYGS